MSPAERASRGPCRLREVVVEVGDVAGAAAFYGRLGLELVKQGHWEGGDYAELSDPEGLKVLLIEGDGGVRLAFTVEDVHAALADAAVEGAVIQAPATPAGGGLWATAADPWGNAIGFWSPMPRDDG
ncbi:MAG: VOC family protein [Actinomycetota bacterium]|nr:VOC family protein [Actinomycetota bacterium]